MSPASQVFAVLFVTILLFLSDKLALDLVALISLLALYFLGILSPEEALSGFANPVVVTLAALFVVGGALFRTGVAAAIGDWIAEKGGQGRSRLVALVMGLSAVLSAFMSSTGTVAVLIPAVMGVAKRNKMSASKLLLPLAYGCLIGGMLTLVGTAPNLVVQEALIDSGKKPFHFFSFLPMGVVVLVIGVVYMTKVGDRMLSSQLGKDFENEDPSAQELAGEYEVSQHLGRFQVGGESRLVGQRLVDTQLRSGFGVNLLGFQKDEDDTLHQPGQDFCFEAGQLVHLFGSDQQLKAVAEACELVLLAPLEDYQELLPEGGLAEVLLTPRSRLLGRTLTTSRFQERYRVNVVALKRRGRVLEEPSRHRLRFGDTLLVAGTFSALEGLWAERGSFVVTGMPEENRTTGFRREKAPIAIALTILMLVLMSFNLLPSVMAVLLVAGASLLTGCLSTEDSYRSVSWQGLILIAFMLPMALALEKTGGVRMVADALTSSLGALGPQAILAGLFLLTSAFSQFISNTATTVVIAPIALEAAAQADVDPHAFLMAVAVAASSAFVTPVASPVNTLVMTPGKYQFADFVKVGLPLQFLVLLASVLLLPILFPL